MSVNKVNSDGSLLRVAGGTLYADTPIGTISPFGGSAIPSGYLLCNGNEVLKTAYAELYAVIGDAFGTASDNTKFKLPDLREATTKGVGLSGKSSAHLDADGLAVGEFLDDRVQTHTHDIVCEFGAAGLPNYSPGDTYTQVAGVNAGSRVPIQAININSGRHGATTEVKAVGVNYIIKAKQVAVPFDMAEYVRNQNVLSDIETVTLPMTAPYDGELIPVASNGGYITFLISGNQYTVGSSAGMTSTSGLPIKKGDNLQLLALVGTAEFTARYYKLRDYAGR